MSDIPEEHRVHRTGGWLPNDHRIHKHWLEKTIKHVDRNPKALHPILTEFQHLIENDTRFYLLFNSMFDQVPHKKPYEKDPVGNRQVRDYKHMLQLLNHLMTTPPSWSNHGHSVGLVGLPFQALFDWPMATSSGFAAFLDPQVNAILKKVLNTWGEYLKSSDSAVVLGTDTNCWFGPAGMENLTTAANVAAGTSLSFEEMFVCDPSAKHHGFTSWDNFFTRTFRVGIRPVAHPSRDEVIVNSCESLPYKVAYDVNAHDKFWIKGQPYSVLDVLAYDTLAGSFVGGTIYQAFLSSLSYHRWHSPVSGKIVKAYVKDGTYYSEPPFTSIAGPLGADTGGENRGQSYIAAVATRALIFIEADNPDIGLMCVVLVGMVEVSTCEITVKDGQHVQKGEQLGMTMKFHFGGSTHCLLFRKGVDIRGFPETDRKNNVPVRSELALVLSSKRAE